MKIDRAAIQAFLATNPTAGEINDILAEISEYTQNRNKREAVWKRQLPYKDWEDVNLRGLFKDVFVQLQSQQISVKYLRDNSTASVQRWRLKKGKNEGGLCYCKEQNTWIIYHFALMDKDGSDIEKFEGIIYRPFCPW